MCPVVEYPTRSDQSLAYPTMTIGCREAVERPSDANEMPVGLGGAAAIVPDFYTRVLLCGVGSLSRIAGMSQDEARTEVIRCWRALAVEERRSAEQAAQFAATVSAASRSESAMLSTSFEMPNTWPKGSKSDPRRAAHRTR
jgi:hypothetical protein